MENDRGAWPEYRGGPDRTPCRPGAAAVRDPIQAAWEVGVRDAQVRAGGIVAADGLIYVARTDGVSVLDSETGQQVWNYTKSVPLALAVEDSYLYVADRSGITALNSKNGGHRWSVTVDFRTGGDDREPEYYPGQLAVSDRRVHLLTDQGITALDRDTGSVLWNYEYAPSPGALAVGQETVFSSNRASAIAVDSRTGSEKWTLDARPDILYGDILGVTQSHVYVSAFDRESAPPNAGFTVKIETDSGDRAGALSPPTEDLLGPPPSPTEEPLGALLVSERAYYFVTYHGQVAKQRNESGSEVEWRQAVDVGERGPALSDVALVGDILYVSTTDGVAGLDVRTGDVEMRYGGIADSTSIVYDDDALLVSSETEVHRLNGRQRDRTKVFDPDDR